MDYRRIQNALISMACGSAVVGLFYLGKGIYYEIQGPLNAPEVVSRVKQIDKELDFNIGLNILLNSELTDSLTLQARTLKAERDSLTGLRFYNEIANEYYQTKADQEVNIEHSETLIGVTFITALSLASTALALTFKEPHRIPNRLEQRVSGTAVGGLKNVK